MRIPRSPRSTTPVSTRRAAPLLAILGLVSTLTAAQTCGNPWTIASGPGPSAREGSAITYDSGRGRVILFGGQNYTSMYGDTWEWTATGPSGGGSWTQVATSGPQPTAGAGMAYDSARHRTVLFGVLNGTSYSNQTWEWDGATWALMQPIQSPPPTAGLLAFDPVRARTVMLSSSWYGNGTSHTWEYDGATWTLSNDVTPPFNEYSDSIAFDSARSTMMALSGGSYTGTLWERAASGWQVVPSDRPARGNRLAFDSRLGRLVVPTDHDYNGPASLWTWDSSGHRWNVMNTNGPEVGDAPAVAYDAAGSQLLVFGGNVSSNISGQTRLARTDISSGPTLTNTTPDSLSLRTQWFPGALNVEAVGNGPLTYHWRLNGVELTDGGPYSGVTTPHLTITPILNYWGGSYDAVVTDSCGTSIRPISGVGVHCYADCDQSITGNPILTANDFQCFLNYFGAGLSYANCDQSTNNPILSANDFQCFLNRYAAGCN